jgi:hypothetical protein
MSQTQNTQRTTFRQAHGNESQVRERRSTRLLAQSEDLGELLNPLTNTPLPHHALELFRQKRVAISEVLAMKI